MTIDTLPDVSEDVPEGGDAPERRPRRSRLLVVALAAVVLVAYKTVPGLLPDDQVDVRDGTTLVDNDGLAARYGINVSLIGVSAAGGMIDFRYQVVDPDKASRLLHDEELYPKFVVEDTGELLAITSLPHNHGTELELGGTYFFLFANARNAVHPGSPMTVVIGDARVEHVRAQG